MCGMRQKWRGPFRVQPKRQGACKPGSVASTVSPRFPFGGDRIAAGSHSSRRTVAGTLKQSTRTAGPKQACSKRARSPYSILLRVGFAVPLPLPVARCALAAPFHPYSSLRTSGLLSVALSLDPPPGGVRPGGRYPPPLFRGARTFLGILRSRGCPAPWRAVT